MFKVMDLVNLEQKGYIKIESENKARNTTKIIRTYIATADFKFEGRVFKKGTHFQREF